MNYDGKTVIVTGSSRGLGKELVFQYANAGANVVVTARSKEKINSISKKINDELAGTALAVTADISKEEDVIRLFEKTINNFGQVDILINNAAAHKALSVENTDIDTWEKTLAVNLTGTFLASREAAKIMKSNKSGTIINISSTAADNYFPGFGAYSATKAGIIGFSNVLAEEMRDYNVNVISIKLGLVNTEYTRSRIKNGNPEEWIQPEEASNLILYLTSNSAKIITGTAIEVNGKRK